MSDTLATDLSRCGVCRRPIFFDGFPFDQFTGGPDNKVPSDRWLHWDPSFDMRGHPDAHAATDAPPKPIARTEPGRLTPSTIARDDNSDLLIRRSKTALAS